MGKYLFPEGVSDIGMETFSEVPEASFGYPRYIMTCMISIDLPESLEDLHARPTKSGFLMFALGPKSREPQQAPNLEALYRDLGFRV